MRKQMTARRRIVYQLVAPMEKTLGAAEVERRREYLQRYAGERTEIAMQSIASGFASIESERDAVVVGPHLLSGLQRAESEGASAGIIGCFSDPALAAIRETVTMPVIGPGQASIMLALQLGDRFSVLTPLASGDKRTLPRLRSLGLNERLASVRGVGVSVVELANAVSGSWEKILSAGQQCIEDGADVLVLGCMSMASRDVDREMSRRLGIPVVNPILAALKSAETMLDLGLSHSRLAWPAPPVKTYVA
jgi:allantoin racemase